MAASNLPWLGTFPTPPTPEVPLLRLPYLMFCIQMLPQARPSKDHRERRSSRGPLCLQASPLSEIWEGEMQILSQIFSFNVLLLKRPALASLAALRGSPSLCLCLSVSLFPPPPVFPPASCPLQATLAPESEVAT